MSGWTIGAMRWYRSFCVIFAAWLIASRVAIAQGQEQGWIAITRAGNLNAYLTSAAELYAPPPIGIKLANILGPVYGFAYVRLHYLNSTTSRITLSLKLTGLSNITGGGVYQASADANANYPSVNFNRSITAAKGRASNESVLVTVSKNISTTLADAIYATPDEFYVQVLTAQSPHGAIRGQLEDDSVAGGVGLSPDDILGANLTGSDVSPIRNPSDLQSAEVYLFVHSNASSNTSWPVYLSISTLLLSNITSAALYAGAANSSGSILVDFTAAIRLSSLNANQAFRGYEAVNVSIIEEVLQSPSSYFFQLATTRLPQGAVRGQLQRRVAPPPPPLSAPAPLEPQTYEPPPASADAAPPPPDSQAFTPLPPSEPPPTNPKDPQTGGVSQRRRAPVLNTCLFIALSVVIWFKP